MKHWLLTAALVCFGSPAFAGIPPVIGSGGTATIADGSIDTAKLASWSVDTSKIRGTGNVGQVLTQAAGGVAVWNDNSGAATINDGDIDTAKLGGAAVTNGKILDGAVTTAKIAANAVDTTKLGSGAVGQSQLQNNSITTAKIVDAAVDTTKILTGAVDTNRLNTDAVTTVKILDGAVTAQKIAAGAIDSSKLSSGLTLPGGALINTGSLLKVGTSPTITNAVVVGTDTHTGTVFAFLGVTASGGGLLLIDTRALGSGTGGQINLDIQNTPTAADQRLGLINFGSVLGGSQTNNVSVASVEAFSDEAWTGSSRASYLKFLTTVSGSTSRAERARIGSNGYFGIGGAANPRSIFDVDAGSGVGQATLDGASGGCIMLRDTDDAGWTECDALDGVLTCSIDADGVCD